MNIKVLAIAALLIIASAFGYMYQSNKASTEKAKQQNLAYEQQQQQAKQDAIDAEKAREQQQAQIAKAKELKLEKEKQDQNKQIQVSKDEKNQAEEKNKKELQDFKVIFDKWMTQDNIASSTARIAVAAPVTELRKIRDELNSLQITGCLVGSKSKLLSAMDDEILMFVYFMQNNVSSIAKVEELKISYFNKLADAIESQTACRK